jgi:hypothetical protein
MPVTARLSKLFYERLGEEVTNELVDWFNQVDASYRTELKEFNELNFARFDAKLEQRVAELHAKLDSRLERVELQLNARIDRVAGELDSKIDRVVGELNAKIDARLSDVIALLERRLGEQTRWLFVAWASLLIPIIGLWIRG